MRQMKRFNWLSAGRRWRKTTLGLHVAIAGVPERGILGVLQRKTVIWGAPTYDQVRIGWNEARHAAAGIASFSAQRMTADFPGGGRIIYRSLDDPDNARGHTADGVIIDEAGDVKEAAWYEVLRPILIDTGGWAFNKGTPRGRNWFWREWTAAHDREDSAAWQIPTKGCRIENGSLVRAPDPLENPDIPWSEIEQLYLTLPQSVFEQEVMAVFLSGEGAVFRNIRACLAVPPDGPLPGGVYVMGVDWAQSRDFTALVVMDVQTRQVVAVDRFNQIGWDVQRGRLAALAQQWNIAAVLAEQNSIGGPNVEALQREGLPVYAFQTTSQSKQNIIVALQLAFERGDIRIPDDPVLISELEAYEATRLPSGRWRYEAPAGVHDDTVIALSLALEAANLMAAGPSQGLVVYDDPVNISPY